MHHDPASDLDLALRMADEADRISMGYFADGCLEIEAKADGSPVTDADRQVETRLRDLVAAERPGDALLGEEIGEVGAGGRRWIVDGIDGTSLFIAGSRGWGTEIALEVDGRVVVGVSSCPSMGRRWWARRGCGAWTTSSSDGATSDPRRTSVTGRAHLAGGKYTSIPPLAVLVGARRDLVTPLGACCEYRPPEQHGALLVAEGLVDVCVQTGGGPWDFAALAVIVEEAGGRFSDHAGDWRIDRGGPVVFSNYRLHAEALATLRGWPARRADPAVNPP